MRMLIARPTRRFIAAALIGLGLLPGASLAADKPLRIGVSAGPYGDILRETAKLAAREGLQAEIIEFTEWTQINEALQLGDIDANNFQHEPYLNNQKRQRGYDIVPLASSIVVPLGIYSSKVTSLADLPRGGECRHPERSDQWCPGAVPAAAGQCSDLAGRGRYRRHRCRCCG